MMGSLGISASESDVVRIGCIGKSSGCENSDGSRRRWGDVEKER